MRTLLLAGVLAVAGLAAPASAQVAIDTPIGGVRVGPQSHHYRDYDRRGYNSYGYYRGYDRGSAVAVALSRSSVTTAQSVLPAVADNST